MLRETLSADIVAAIRELEGATGVDGNIETSGASRGRGSARAALTATILRLNGRLYRLEEPRTSWWRRLIGLAPEPRWVIVEPEFRG